MILLRTARERFLSHKLVSYIRTFRIQHYGRFRLFPSLVSEHPNTFQGHGGLHVASQRRLIHTRNQFQYLQGSNRAATPGSAFTDDEAIKSFKVYVVNADNKLDDPILLHDALAARNKDDKGKFTEILRQVQPASPSLLFPICKYMSLKSLKEKELALEKHERMERASRKQSKRLELNWTIGDNDLAHRMERLREFLSKGRSVEVTLGTQRKRGWQKKRPDSLETAEQLVQKVKAAAFEVNGSREAKEMTGDMGNMVVLYFEGPRKAKDESSE